jgi:hypothetical protein
LPATPLEAIYSTLGLLFAAASKQKLGGYDPAATDMSVPGSIYGKSPYLNLLVYT